MYQHNTICFYGTPTSKINGAVTYKRIKVMDAERTENLQKNVYPVMEVVSVAVNVDVELS